MSHKISELQKRKDELAKKKAAIGSTSASKHDYKAKELKFLGKWSVKSINELVGIGSDKEGSLLGVNTAGNEYSYVSADDKETVRALKEAVDVAVMESQLFGKKVSETKAYQTRVKPIMQKAFGIASGDEGFEWIPTGVSTSYIDEYNLERKVSGLFQEIRMPTNPYKFPVLSNGAVAKKLGVAAALSPKDVFETDKTITFDAIKMSNQYLLPEELSEDSAVNILQVIRQELIEGAEKAIEVAILNGDTDTTHQDSASIFGGGAPAANSSERFWDGLRKRAIQATLALSGVDAGNNAVEYADIQGAREKMGKFGVNPKELALICSPKGYNQLINLTEVTTVEKYGSAATILTGELARVGGIPVIVSEYMREDLNATAVNDGVTEDRTSMILVNRRRFMLGLRRALQIRIERNQTDKDAVDMVSYARYAFQGVLAADGANYATESSVALIYNIS
jgi:HK97 family phage major capsid protein